MLSLPVLAVCEAAEGVIPLLPETADISWHPAGLPVPEGQVVGWVLWNPEPEALHTRLSQPEWETLAWTRALVIVAPGANWEQRSQWLAKGAQEVLGEVTPEALSRALTHAVARKQRELANRLSYATDLATGLPHQAQLIEHMNQLLALREREPAPMALIVLRVQGLGRAAERVGEEGASVLRRKLAVRLRSGLRAGDVVASTSPDSFAVLLGHVEAAADGERVLAKLVRALEAPIQVAGQPFGLSVAAGLACYPEHGRLARELLQRATAQSESWAPMGREGVAVLADRRDGTASANDPVQPV
jgi:diguanylate cyclase (GGDEF)-like protein